MLPRKYSKSEILVGKTTIQPKEMIRLLGFWNTDKTSNLSCDGYK